jgi:hypothetical protein
MTGKYGRRPRKAAYKMFSSPPVGLDAPRSVPSAWFEKWTPNARPFLLAVLSLGCAYFALAGGRGLFGTVFFAISVTAVLGATHAPIGWNQEHYDVLEDGVVGGPHFLDGDRATAATVDVGERHNGAIERIARLRPDTRASAGGVRQELAAAIRATGRVSVGETVGTDVSEDAK